MDNGDYTNTATVSANQPDPHPANNTSTVSVTPHQPTPPPNPIPMLPWWAASAVILVLMQVARISFMHS